MSNRIQFRRDTAARWTSINPILQEGELGLETDTRFCKIGDGVHAWNELQYSTAFHNITHELGTDENLVLSQKGAKVAIDNLKTEIDEDVNNVETKIDDFIKQHSGIQSFSSIVLSADILHSTTINQSGSIVYVRSAKRFAYLVGTSYYGNWTAQPSVDKYLNSNRSAILTDRLYVCQGVLYFWDGEDLVAVKDNLSQNRGQREDIAMSQKAVTDSFIEIEKTIWPLNIIFNISPNQEYTGTNKDVIINWDIQRMGETINDANISLLQISKDGDSIYSQRKARGVLSVGVNSLDDVMFEIYVEAEGMADGAGKMYRQFLPFYMGFLATSNTSIDFSVEKLTKYPQEYIAGTYTISNNNTGNYLWIVIPSDSIINRITLNGFDVPMITSENVSTSLGTFKTYRSANALAKQSFTFKIE